MYPSAFIRYVFPRIGLGYRALPDHVVWYWIGTHSEYDRLV